MINKYNIKAMYKIQGKSLREISKLTGHTFRTVKKYAEMDDFSDKVIRKKGCSALDNFKPIINKWLEDDLKSPAKQRHTAKRIYERLCDEYSETFNMSYRTVCEYTSKSRNSIQEIKKNDNGMLHLIHHPGEAQVDFGVTQFVLNNTTVDGFHLVMSFPYSNHSYVQLFPAQNQEALFQGMKNIFEYIGKVPKEIWFDNMSTAVSKIKVGGKRILTDRFMQFTAHYGYEAKFCNPASGNEKGNVENKVGYTRRNLMVPIPKIDSLKEFNENLLALCDKDSQRDHYLKEEEIKTLFKEDIEAMYHLNKNPYDVFKLIKLKANAMGYVRFEHTEYSVLPNYKNQEVWIKIFVDKVEILDNSYKFLSEHKRSYDKNNKVTNWKDWMKVLSNKIRAFEYTEFYQELPKVWKDYFKGKPSNNDRKKIVSALADMMIASDIATATAALENNLSKGVTDVASLVATFRAIREPRKEYDDLSKEDIHMPPQVSFEPELDAYDSLMEVI